jgi:hypothetical protein
MPAAAFVSTRSTELDPNSVDQVVPAETLSPSVLPVRQGGRPVPATRPTDAARNTQEAVDVILDGLRWLGLDWDEGPEVGGPFAPYFQSQRAESYMAAAMKLDLLAFVDVFDRRLPGAASDVTMRAP